MPTIALFLFSQTCKEKVLPWDGIVSTLGTVVFLFSSSSTRVRLLGRSLNVVRLIVPPPLNWTKPKGFHSKSDVSPQIANIAPPRIAKPCNVGTAEEDHGTVDGSRCLDTG
eukprot:2154002-Rhodomonas_salina.1